MIKELLTDSEQGQAIVVYVDDIMLLYEQDELGDMRFDMTKEAFESNEMLHITEETIAQMTDVTMNVQVTTFHRLDLLNDSML